MFATCGKPKLSEANLNHLGNLGQAIHAGIQPLVFDRGFVRLVEQRESEVISNAATSTRNGSASRQGQGRRAWARTRSTRKAEPFRSRAVEEAHGAGFRLLAHHYEALGFEDENGLWVAVKSKPLGPQGPQANFIVAAPNNREITLRAWAFERLGPNAALFPLKHTNFPDASICAFTNASKAWLPEDGLLPLVDHYSLWAVKSWHRKYLGWWPGSQVGVCALYRRNEFVGEEKCGCESGKRYSACHQGRDLLITEEVAQQEFRTIFREEYSSRCPPKCILEAARTKWRNLPPMRDVIPMV